MTDKREICGIPVSAAGLGCWTFGRTVDKAVSLNIVHAALDAGINFFDVADGYGKGLAEEYLGEALHGRREKVFIASKVGAGRGSGHRTALGYRQNAGGSEPGYVREVLERTLRRLDTDYLDLLQLHDPDPQTDLGETLETLDELVKAGTVRCVGCSNYAAAQLRQAGRIARERGLSAFATAQNQYSLLHQAPREELIPTCAELGLRLLPYFPLANGVLTGKYSRSSEPPGESRISTFLEEGRGDKAARFFNERNLRRVERLTAFANERDRSLLELAFGWLLSQPVVPTVIAGASNPDQARANAEASDWRLSPDEMSEVHALLDDGLLLVCADSAEDEVAAR